MSKVSRSTYQRVVQENRKLMKDIRILTEEKHSLTAEKILLIHNYREKFKAERQTHEWVKRLLQKLNN